MERADETIIHEEEALLERALRAIEHARRARSTTRGDGGLRDVDELRSMRDEASATAEDDLPSLLHEMSVRQRLRERSADDPLPDVSSPYVAHLRIEEDGEQRDYLLGQASFFDVRAGVRIVDWRTAPIAQVFYRYREGDDIEEEIADRVRTGVVVSRRIVVVEDGRLTRILADGVALAWTAEHGWARDTGPELADGGAGTAARGGVLGGSSLGIGV
ncbi:MAG: DNA helicase, partial [Myxococcota bacterium]|nr:DNA helicase [Myxococcota bacterium]